VWGAGSFADGLLTVRANPRGTATSNLSSRSNKFVYLTKYSSNRFNDFVARPVSGVATGNAIRTSLIVVVWVTLLVSLSIYGSNGSFNLSG
jgi:hypothetical protein